MYLLKHSSVKFEIKVSSTFYTFYFLPSLLLMAYEYFFEKFENIFCILGLFIYYYSMGHLVRKR